VIFVLPFGVIKNNNRPLYDVTHWHGSAGVLYKDRQRKSMGKSEILPLATPKPLHRSLPNFANVITSWMPAPVQKLLHNL